jgi:hypothetical protein
MHLPSHPALRKAFLSAKLLIGPLKTGLVGKAAPELVPAA